MNLENLNKAQKEAVKYIDGPLLILAGAGSGKTKTITTRLAYLISEVGIPAKETLTLTFTNKAATEMRQRALALIKDNKQAPPLLCTFHKFGLMFLKFYISRLNRKNNFSVIDSADKKRILKSLIDAKDEISTSLVISEISNYKNAFLSPKDVSLSKQKKEYELIAKIYELYEDYLQTNNLVDFDDLLLLPYKILKDNLDLREEINNKYRYITIDEYQDINNIQFRLIKLLSAKENNICVVGDEDQSIYGWRGANVRNILDFQKQFANTKLIKLEINYRSTKQILDLANNLISHNKNRLAKKLESFKGEGSDVLIMSSENETEETIKIAKYVKNLLKKGEANIAVLYRVNALSRALEEGFNKANISYKLVGGVRFYDRTEIKDLISYLRLILNFDDDFSFKRIVNKPKRGLGKVTLSKLEVLAKELKISIFDLIVLYEDKLLNVINSKNIKTLKDFCMSIKILRDISNKSPMKLIDELETMFRIKNSYSSLPDSFDRMANIDEFYALYKDKIQKELSLEDFLNEIALTGEQDEVVGEEIFFMSIHASKGLEFDYVFLIGLEENFLPITGDSTDIEEERRLSYVAFTRAKKELILSHSNSRFYKGDRKFLKSSSFLNECGMYEAPLKLSNSIGFSKGDLVKHKIFGVGRVKSVLKSSNNVVLSIDFTGMNKNIMSNFIEKI